MKWATTDYVFEVNMSTSGAPFRERPGIKSHIMFPLDGKFEVDVNCVYNICLFELSSCTDKIAPLVLTFVILELVLGCQEGQILSIHLHPTSASSFFFCAATPEAVVRIVSFFPFSAMSNEHGNISRNTPRVLSRCASQRRLMVLRKMSRCGKRCHFPVVLNADVGLVELSESIWTGSAWVCRSLLSRTRQQSRSKPS